MADWKRTFDSDHGVTYSKVNSAMTVKARTDGSAYPFPAPKQRRPLPGWLIQKLAEEAKLEQARKLEIQQGADCTKQAMRQTQRRGEATAFLKHAKITETFEKKWAQAMDRTLTPAEELTMLRSKLKQGVDNEQEQCAVEGS